MINRVLLRVIVAVCILLPGIPRLYAMQASNVSLVPIPAELQSHRFAIEINGVKADVFNAAANYYDLNFELNGPVSISITAPSADYWARGVEVQPWREHIRPERNGATISFTLDHPAKLSISRPGDHLAGAEMIFLFANKPQSDTPLQGAKGVRYYGPGLRRGSINAHSGDKIYLASGAVVLGGLNLWKVHDVKVYGLGTILYDGPQNPADDEGWKNKKSWHCVTMHEARNIEIDDITCAVRSRTWMIQMRDSHSIVFDNVKEIGGSPSNANQDGMDWLGGGDTVVRNSFIRAADDIFSMEGNWDGYPPALMTRPGHDVNNIVIEKSVLSTSISNVVRVGWPTKTFDSDGFILRDSDVIHMGSGGCGIPFALFEFWGVPDAKGSHSNYLFDDVRLEDWYSLVQLQQKAPSIRNVTFQNIWAPELPAMVGSGLLGDVEGVHLDRVKIGDRYATGAADIPITHTEGATAPDFDMSSNLPEATFTVDAEGAIVGKPIRFDASATHAGSSEITAYDWFFGDGSEGHGETIQHSYKDTDGTLLDGSGSFRVMLRVTDAQGRSDWSAENVVVPSRLLPASTVGVLAPGLHYTSYAGVWKGLPDFADQTVEGHGVSQNILTYRNGATNYGYVFDGYIRVPRDGGYNFDVFSRDGGLLQIDGVRVAQSPKPWPQVCGSVGNAVQAATGSIGLAAGLHKIHVEMTHTAGEDDFRVLWEGPGISLSAVPETMLFHDSDK